MIDGGLISPTPATGRCPPLVPGLGDPARRPAQWQGALSQEPAIPSTHCPPTPPPVSPSAQQGQVW